MFRGLFQLAWLEIKIFLREPLGVFGTVFIPVLMFVLLGRVLGSRGTNSPFAAVDLPILVSLLVAASTVLSLVAIISIYREGGILKRLRATPLRPHTILIAHVLVKLLFTTVTLLLMFFAGRRFLPAEDGAPLVSFILTMLFTTVCILSLGFVIASVVPTARFAQPLGSLILYPMLGLSGLFVPLSALSPALRALARVTPFTYAVSLLRGVWEGDGWIGHADDIAVLLLIFAVCTTISARVFRWE